MVDKSEILELVDHKFSPVTWAEFTKLTLREIARRPFVLKTHGLYFVGDGFGTGIEKIVAKRHPDKVHGIVDWFEVILPHLSSDMLDKSLIELPMVNISEATPLDVLERIQRVIGVNTEVVA